MQKNKLFLLFFLLFFVGLLGVNAASEGISDTTHYEETDKRTNYIKLELENGHLALFQIDSSNSSLARQFKDYIFNEHYDHANVGLTAGIYEINPGNFEGMSCNFNNFKTPVYGDLIAIYDHEECAVSSFQIYTGERGDSKLPVIGHLIAGSGTLQNSFTSIASVRFVTISKENTNESSNGTENKNESGGQTSRPSVTNYCSNDLELLKTFKFIGRILSIIKILIPLIIIILGFIDFFRAVIASKDDEIKKSMKSLLFRVISGVVIFFLPTIINLVFMLIDDWGNYRTDYSVCSTCVTNPSKCKV